MDADGVVYIGKEANNIDDHALGVKRHGVFWNMEEVKERIMKIPLMDASKYGFYKSTLWRLSEADNGVWTIKMDEGSDEDDKIMCSNEPADQCVHTIKLVCSFSPADRDRILCH